VNEKRPSEDIDPQETLEWSESLEAVIERHGPDRAGFLLNLMSERLSKTGQIDYRALTTPYRNTIPVADEATMPGDLATERRIRSLVRWNALATVMRANMNEDELGGHISTFQSVATLYDVGFNNFWRAPSENH